MHTARCWPPSKTSRARPVRWRCTRRWPRSTAAASRPRPRRWGWTGTPNTRATRAPTRASTRTSTACWPGHRARGARRCGGCERWSVEQKRAARSVRPADHGAEPAFGQEHGLAQREGGAAVLPGHWRVGFVEADVVTLHLAVAGEFGRIVGVARAIEGVVAHDVHVAGGHAREEPQSVFDGWKLVNVFHVAAPAEHARRRRHRRAAPPGCAAHDRSGQAHHATHAPPHDTTFTHCNMAAGGTARRKSDVRYRSCRNRGHCFVVPRWTRQNRPRHDHRPTVQV